jgi:hypothetical protein
LVTSSFVKAGTVFTCCSIRELRTHFLARKK